MVESQQAPVYNVRRGQQCHEGILWEPLQARQGFNDISNLKATSSVQKYLHNINRLNVCTKLPDHYQINIILYTIITYRCRVIAHYEDIHSFPSKWQEKLPHMDFITIEFQKKE